MKQVVNYFNKIEVYFLVIWTTIIILQKLFELHLGSLVIVSSCTLSVLYWLQAAMAYDRLKGKSIAIRSYPIILGLGSAVLILGVLFKVMHYPGAAVQSTAGMIIILASCLLLFYQPIQDEYLPVLKKILLRQFLLITLGFMFSL